MALSKEEVKKNFFSYTEEAMVNAIKSVRNESMTVYAASKLYGVPITTLRSKIKGISPETRKMGPPTILSFAEEELLIEWIGQIAKAGFPLMKEDLLVTVQKIVNGDGRVTPFKNGKPGDKWFHAFLRRHPEITKRVPEQLTGMRANITEQQIRQWFSEVKSYLESKNMSDILLDPRRVYNADESGFLLSPKSNRVICLRGEKNIYEVVKGSGKDSITVLITVSGNGDIAPPFIVHACARLRKDIVQSTPNAWALGKSESGWMTAETFYEFITNVFHPWLVKNDITRPIVLFIDGHKSHLTLNLSNFCSENQIEIVALYPNSTHVLQPCDVSLFKPMKESWKSIVHQWRINNNHESVTKQNFAALFKNVFDCLTPENIRNGFARCGIYPFSPDAVDYSKCISKVSKESNSIQNDQKYRKTALRHLKYIESFIPSDLGNHFKTHFAQNLEWSGETTAKELFSVWKKMKLETFSSSTIQASESVEITETQESSQEEYFDVKTEEIVTHSATSLHDHTFYNTPIKCLNTSSSDIIENSDASVSTPFKSALFWPEQKSKSVKKKREKIPSVVTSEEWKKFYEKKEQIKKQKEEEKEKRKLARESKKQKIKNEVQKSKIKRKQKQLPANKRNKIEDTESESDADVIYDDSCDSFNFNSKESDNGITCSEMYSINLLKENYYAVHYNESYSYFIGRVLEFDDKKVKVKFLKENVENNFIWPQNNDIEEIEREFVFFGPVSLLGNGPFSLLSQDLKKIKSAYRVFKSKI